MSNLYIIYYMDNILNLTSILWKPIFDIIQYKINAMEKLFRTIKLELRKTDNPH